MNRRQLFLNTAKAALATAFSSPWLVGAVKAQTPSTAAGVPAAGGGGLIYGTPGSTAATRTIPGDVLPPHDLQFGGTIGLDTSQSTPWWSPRVVPPEGAPNILLIITDDVGFGAPSTFGGVIPTPSLDRVAESGLRYTNFHSTALCSPTRAALITGRNHHSVGYGVVGEIATGFPGYDSIIPIEKGTIGTILKANGYPAGKAELPPDATALGAMSLRRSAQ